MTTLGSFTYPDHLREVLARRTPTSHRFAVPVDDRGLCQKCRQSVKELRDRGLAVLLDQAPMNGREVYVHLLTARGVALCKEGGIDAR
jgi:hypothetical protein